MHVCVCAREQTHLDTNIDQSIVQVYFSLKSTEVIYESSVPFHSIQAYFIPILNNLYINTNEEFSKLYLEKQRSETKISTEQVCIKNELFGKANGRVVKKLHRTYQPWSTHMYVNFLRSSSDASS